MSTSTPSTYRWRLRGYLVYSLYTNLDYLKYRWQICRFDGKAFLEKFKGKKIMYIGDSLSLNIYEYRLCLLHAAVPEAKFNQVKKMSLLHLCIYGVEIVLFHSNLLSTKDGQIWKNFDILIFDTWLWYTRRPPGQQYFVEYNGQILKDINWIEAFRTGLKTWARWVETDVDTTKTKVFFQGTSLPRGEPTINSCLNETTPINGSI
uniref:Trichome birefringence-like C-terminal domain-containing protein n=1 Tax=Solanum lycopersicum TaxID=4081 RepID=A0A3Q7HB21_SOLLC